MIKRREFLGAAGLGAAGFLLPEARAEQPAEQPKGPVIDFHTHLFGIGDSETCCYMSDRVKSRINYKVFQKLLGLHEGTVDQDYVAELVRQLGESSVSKAVLLAYDARYGDHGEVSEDTDVHIPNEYLFKVVADHPGLFIPCISINPKRKDALEHLDWCAAQGARALKIHPPTQDVDPGEERFRPFYRRLAEHNIILMVHTGAEHSAETVGDDFSDPRLLLPALEEGCTVIASHAGMGAFFDDSEMFEQFFRNLAGLITRFPTLYADTAILAQMFRWRNIPRLLREPEVVERLVHGSDWPFPSSALAFWNRLPVTRTLELASEDNLFERDLQLKQALGLPPGVFERGGKLLS